MLSFLRREITKKLTYSVIIKIIREVMVKNITLGPSEVQPHDSWIRQNVRSFKSCWKKKMNRTNIPLIPRLVPRFSNTSRIEELGAALYIRRHVNEYSYPCQKFPIFISMISKVELPEVFIISWKNIYVPFSCAV